MPKCGFGAYIIGPESTRAVIRLALTQADVTGPPTTAEPEGATYLGATVLIRNDRLVIQSRTGVVLHEVPAQGARQLVSRHWEVDTDEGLYGIRRKTGG